MPRLFIKTNLEPDLEAGALDLRVGVNRIGRGPGNHLQIHDPSVSNHHCEVMVGVDTMIVTDLGSSNGTFIDGVLIREGFLFPGQTLQIGIVELFVETRLQISRSGLTPWHRMNALREALEAKCARHPLTGAVLFCPRCRLNLCYSCSYGYRHAYGLKVYFCRVCGTECVVATEPRQDRREGVAYAEAGSLQETIRRSLLPYLASWLKEKLVQVLLQQRAGLIQTQDAATAQMIVYEKRLAKVQEHMEQRIRTYELEIKNLKADLGAAEAENRHLIEARMQEVRQEFERESRAFIDN